jgi:hypothetical protein
MIKVPAEKLARAVEKHLLPGLMRSLAEQQKSQEGEKKSS